MKIFEQFKGKRVFIYGAGVYGKWVFEKLYQDNIPVTAFLDINVKGTLFDLPEYKADEYTWNKEGIVIAAIVKPYAVRQEIFQFIKDCGFESVVDAQSIRCHSVNYDEGLVVKDMADAIDLFQDKHSREINRKNTIAHLRRDYSDCIESIDSVQYFPDDIPMDYDRVIDCGGYTGDTAELFIEKGATDVCVFEPDKVVFKKLSENLCVYRQPSLFMFPLAVSDIIDNSIVTIDSVVRNLAPTFIKMDIEGDELRALKGAKNTIKRYAPDLAICVYHRINHIWDIPLLLDSWNLGYKFHLKCHNSYTMETVLYATA